MRSVIFVFLIIVAFWGIYSFTEAAELRLKYAPPCPPGRVVGECVGLDASSTDVSANNLSNYIRRVYQFAVGISGILAVGMIVVGGIYISVSAGSPDKQKEGKDMIVSAIWGIVLVLGSYLILRTVNPRLVKLPSPEVEEIKNLGRKYFLEKFQCPTAGQTGCFFDDKGNACDFQDPDKVCNAIERGSTVCKDGKPYPCTCEKCQVLDESEYAVKSDACSDGTTISTLGKCMLEKNTLLAFKIFYGNLHNVVTGVPLGTGSKQWRVTEAFPPTSPHNSPLHYNGKAFDFGRDGVDISNQIPPLTDKKFCEEIEKIIGTAKNLFKKMIIEGLTPGYCPELKAPNLPQGVERMTFLKTTGFHIHMENPNLK